MEQLLQNGADVNANVEGRSALWALSVDSPGEDADVLIRHGANVNQAV